MSPRADDPDRKEKSKVAKRGNTRRDLLDAALEMVQRTGSFGTTSLRQITKQAGVVPTAFYRHFKDMDTLGLTLIDESFRTLRQMMREVRKQKLPTQQIIRTSVESYFNYMRMHHQHFLFVVAERYTGNPIMRTAIKQEIRLFTSELATDLSRLLPVDKVSSEDLQIMASLIVNTLASATQLMTELIEQEHTEFEQKS